MPNKTALVEFSKVVAFYILGSNFTKSRASTLILCWKL